MLTLLAFAALVIPQDTIRWTEPTCRSCRIEIEQVVALVGPDLQIPTGPFGIARGRTSWYALQWYGDSTEVGIYRFTLDGKPAGKVARWGHGPGEVETPTNIRVDAHDSVHVLDRTSGKRLVFDPAGRYVRSHPVPRIISGSFIFTPGGGVVVNASGMGETGGWPLYAFDAAGNVLGSWPEARYQYQLTGFAAVGERFIVGDYSSFAWVVHGMSYKGPITELRNTKTGDIVALYRREGKWMHLLPPPPKFGAPPPRELQKPHSFAIGATISDGVLWIAYQTADPDWRRGFGRIVRDSAGFIQDTPDFDDRRVLDMVLDAVDVRTGKLLASRRLDLEMVPSPGGLLIRPFDTADSHVEIIYRPRLIR